MDPVGKFVPSEKLGAGASGEVWKARDTVLNRWVALKFLRGGDDEEVARFQREAQVAGRLSHPNIAAIHEVGEAGGRRYIAMQLVEGRTLRGWPVSERRRAVEMMRDAARAVAYAHSQGVVHRDLKPENLMVAGGHVYVMDFGLARAQGGAGVSVSGAILGTPAYMPPEQARGEKADARSDVYGLGATLHALLTGEPPFDGPSVFETLRRVQESDPRPTRADADLDAIVLRCLEKDRARRYATATELAEDLSRWLAGEPVVARAPSVARRVHRALARRKPLVVAVVAGLAVVGVVASVMAARIARERRMLALWERITPLMADAEMNDRAGEQREALARLDAAIRICERSVAEGELAQARYFLGRLRRSRADAAGARRELDRALELDPTMAEAHLERGLLLVDEISTKLFEGNEDPMDVWAAKFSAPRAAIRSLEAREPGLAARAEADLQFPTRDSPYCREEDRLYGQAELKRLRGETEEAERLLRKVLALRPIYVQAHVALARIARARKEPEAALDHIRQAIERHRGFADAYVERVFVHFEQKRVDETLAAAAEAMALGRHLAVLHYVRGRALEIRRDLDGAIAEFDRSLAISPAPRVLVSRGWMRHAKGDERGAIVDYEKALALHPRFVMAFACRGVARAALAETEAAMSDFARSIELQPDYAAAYSFRGIVRSKTGDHEGAIADFTRALELQPDDETCLKNRAYAHDRKGDIDAALRDYAEVVRRDPTDARTWTSRAAIQLSAARWRDAVDDATRLLAVDPKSVDGHYMRGMARFRMGERAGAKEDLERALSLAEPGWGGTEDVRRVLERLRSP